MTTYAYANGILAVDSLYTEKDGSTGETCKLFVLGGAAMTGSGDQLGMMRVMEWYMGGGATEFPAGECDVLVVCEAGILRFAGTPEPEAYEITDDLVLAGGSGSMEALQALEDGFEAADAVYEAAKTDPLTGGRIFRWKAGWEKPLDKHDKPYYFEKQKRKGIA